MSKNMPGVPHYSSFAEFFMRKTYITDLLNKSYENIDSDFKC